MFKSNTFGRAFWLDDDNEFVSCPLFVNNEPDLSQVDYVSEWTDLEGVNLENLLSIHQSCLYNAWNHGGSLTIKGGI